jgi:hypothetical protein
MDSLDLNLSNFYNKIKYNIKTIICLTNVTEVNCSTQNEVEMAAYLFQFYEMFHHEPIPQTGPMQHDDMDVNMNMDTIETPDTERVFIDYHIDKDYNRVRDGFIVFNATFSEAYSI